MEFYNTRRRQLVNAKSNKVHLFLAKLENNYDVTISTQNIDDLHVRASFSNIIHLYGVLTKARSEVNPKIIVDILYKEIAIGDMAEDGYQLRSTVVWFGEMVLLVQGAANNIKNADCLVVIGRTLVAYPIVRIENDASKKYIIDTNNSVLRLYYNWIHIKRYATEGVM